MNKDIKKGQLYLEAIIYVVGLLYGVYLYSAGGYFINLIPIIFILGLLGKVIFDRPLMTTILGMIFNMFVVYQLYGISGKLNFLSSIYIGIMLMAGEIVGQIYYAIYEKNKKEKRAKKIKIRDNKISKNSKLSLPISVAIILFTVILIHSYVNGNIIEYLVKRNLVDNYINDVYKDSKENLKIREPKIELSINNRDYKFNVENLENGGMYSITIRDNGYIEDEFQIVEKRLETIKINDSINEIMNSKFSGDEYSDLSVITNNNKIIIIKKVLNETEEEKQTFSKQTYEIIKELRKSNVLESIAIIDTKLIQKSDGKNSIVTIDKKIFENNLFDELYVYEALDEEIIDIN